MEETWRKKKHLGDLGVNGRISLKLDLTDIGYEDVNCIHLAQDKMQWHSCEQSTAHSGSIKESNLLACRVTVLLKGDSVPLSYPVP